MSDIHLKFAYPTQPQGALPSFASIEEEAAFWDSHDVTDLSELGPDDLPANPNEYEFVLELSPTEVKLLLDLARSRGVSPTALVGGWVKERLQNETLATASR